MEKGSDCVHDGGERDCAYTKRHGHGGRESLADEDGRNGDAEELGEHVDVK